ncbi:hypothetical protein T06_2068 [Trichinella sp. T6]|nr:hypothetical protein T06_2068 [Trichinella sp. T6]
MFLHPLVEKVCLNMLYNWPWTLSVTLMLPWTPYSSFDVQEKKGGGRSTGWTSENASVKPQQCFHETPLNSISTALFALKVYKGFVVECQK